MERRYVIFIEKFPKPPQKKMKNIDKNQIKSNFDRWCHATPWHGVLEFHTSRNYFLKFAWAIAIIVSVVLSVGQCCYLCIDYLSHDHWLTSVTYEDPKEFLGWPDIAVWNLNGLFFQPNIDYEIANHESVDLYVISQRISFGEDSLLFYDQFQARTPILTNQSILREKIEQEESSDSNILSTVYSNGDMDGLMNLVVMKCNETALRCGATDSFDLRNPNTCCNRTVAHAGKIFISSASAFGQRPRLTGRRSSVYVLFNPQTSNYRNFSAIYEVPSAGLHVELFYGPYEAAVKSELLLAPGTHAMVSLIKEKYRTVVRRTDFGLAIFDFETMAKPCADEYNYTYYDYKKYSVSLCTQDCVIKHQMDTCGCTTIPASSISSKRARQCVGGKIIQCVGNLNTSSVQVPLYCTRSCKVACEYNKTDMRLSVTEFPAKAKLSAFTTYLNRALHLNFTEEDAKQLIFFEMFYELSQIRVIERVTRTTLAELISNIGGSLGVWTGLSLLGIFQCLVYFAKSIFCCDCKHGCSYIAKRLS